MTPTRVLVSIDPGIDRAAAAIWLDPPTGRVAPQDLDMLATHLRIVRECVTDPAHEIAPRLAQLTDWAGLLVEDVRHLLNLSNLIAIGSRAHAVVEWPAFAGMHRGRARQRSNTTQPNADGMAKPYASTGAIIAGVSRWCGQVQVLPAAKVDRDLKQLIGRKAIERAQATHTGGRLPNNDDARSAVSIGIQLLSLGGAR